MLKGLMIAALIGTAVPAWAEDTRLSGDSRALSRQLSQIDTAYRKGCINRRERDEVWFAAEAFAEMIDMDWQRVRRNAKSFRSGRANCHAARGITRNAHIFNSTPE